MGTRSKLRPKGPTTVRGKIVGPRLETLARYLNLACFNRADRREAEKIARHDKRYRDRLQALEDDEMSRSNRRIKRRLEAKAAATA